HEFRTPLSAMLALLERVESGRVVEKEMLDRYHQTLSQEARRLALLVDKLLDFAQLEAGKKSLSSEHIDLQMIVEEAVRGLARSNPERKIDLIEPAAETNIPVFVDRTAVIHCIQNLLENALKYSAPAAAVTVRTGLHDGAAFVEVADRGIGIPHADQQKIFQ